MHEPDRPLLRRARGLAALLLLAALAAGCNRQHYRQRTDKDVEGIITQKNVFPEWGVKNFHAYPHPDARFADPSDPDHPPYPPDDYAARLLSPNPQHPTKRSGAGRFEGTGYLNYLGTWDAANRATTPAKAPPEKRAVPEVVAPSNPAVAAAPARPKSQPAAQATRFGPLVDPSRSWRSPVGPTGLVVVTGEIEQGGKTVPAVMLVPAAQPEPKADGSPNPKADAPGKGDGSIGYVATGEAATSVLKVLETQQPGYRITLGQAVELGIMNSREFQDRRRTCTSPPCRSPSSGSASPPRGSSPRPRP